MFDQFYFNKKILITGITGFKGSWLAMWLHELGAHVTGYALKPETSPALFDILDIGNICPTIFEDIRNSKSLHDAIMHTSPEIIFHLAAQPLVRLSYSKPVLTYETNVIGTLNVLEAARACESVKAVVNVTTDKCYENMEKARGYKEDEPLGGYDMYSSSKGCAEILSSSYRRSFLKDHGYALATARAGNVIGGGDWAQDRLVPDCIRAINRGEKIEIRNPRAIRPWQHVLEPLSGYMLLAQKLYQEGKNYAEAFNFGPYEDTALTVEGITKRIIQYYGKGEMTICKHDNLHESGLLTLNIEKAKNKLLWNPVYDIEEAIIHTVDWYKKFYNKENIKNFTIKQIHEYNLKLHY